MYKPFHTENIQYIVVNNSNSQDFAWLDLDNFRGIFGFTRFTVKIHINGRKRSFYSELCDEYNSFNIIKFRGSYGVFIYDFRSECEGYFYECTIRNHNGYICCTYLDDRNLMLNEVFVLEDYSGNIFVLDFNISNMNEVTSGLVEKLMDYANECDGDLRRDMFIKVQDNIIY